MNSITCPIAHWADKTPNGAAVITRSATISYSQLHIQIAAAQKYLASVGITRSSKVAILLPNSLENLISLIALTRLGAIGCLLSVRLPTEAAGKLAAGLACRHLIHDRSWLHSVSEVAQIHVNSITSSVSTHDLGDCSISLDSPAVAVFTSGSSGDPKAVLLSYGNLRYNALGSNENIAVGPADRWLLSLPLYHVGGLGIIFRTMLAGGTIVIPDHFADLALTIASHNITHISVVTTQLHRLLAGKLAPKRLQSLKAILIGGSMVPTSLISQSVAAKLPVFTSYGLTEMASQVTTTLPGDAFDRLLTSGCPLPYRRLEISADGEILVRGETCFQGYFTPSGLERSFAQYGWFATGDLGMLNNEGYLTVTGRKDNRFVSGGENIQPEEIERTLIEVQNIEDAVVVPVEHAQFGHRPIAFVKLSPRIEMSEDSIKRQLREKLPGFKIPDRILPWPSELVNAGIKPSRTQLQELACRDLK